MKTNSISLIIFSQNITTSITQQEYTTNHTVLLGTIGLGRVQALLNYIKRSKERLIHDHMVLLVTFIATELVTKKVCYTKSPLFLLIYQGRRRLSLQLREEVK